MPKTIKDYYIMGAGALGKYLLTFFNDKKDMTFHGFLDNKSIGENIIKPNDADKSITVIIGSINYLYEMTVQLKELGFESIIPFDSLTLIYPELQNYNMSYIGLKEDLKNNYSEYEKAYNLLSDEKSKRVFSQITEYRKTFDLNLYPRIADKPELQYCDEVAPRNIGVFVDGGAFNGDTVLRAMKNGFKTDKIYFFEPDELSIKQAKENLKNIKGIKYLPYGISDKEKVLSFAAENAFGSHFTENGNKSVKCVSLDETVIEDKAFIKLDIEGAEKDAILGAERLIKNGSPFAICVYHKPKDIWEIPQLIQQISNNGYKLYLRHYTNNILETVLYGVPK